MVYIGKRRAMKLSTSISHLIRATSEDSSTDNTCRCKFIYALCLDPVPQGIFPYAPQIPAGTGVSCFSANWFSANDAA